MKVYDIQEVFNAGEISPRLHARLGFQKYGAALETCENLLPLPEGGLMRRSGTRYVAAAKSSSVKGRLKKFKFSDTQAYIVEMGDSVLRFFRNQGLISVVDTDAAVTNGLLASDIDTAFSQVWQVDDTPSDNAFVDETTDANDVGDADWTVFTATEANGDYVAMGHTAAFSQIRFDYANGTAGVGGAGDWEYWNGSAWAALTGVTDETADFTTAAADDLTVSWTLPTDWAAVVINSSASLFYVRHIITSTYSTNPVLDQGFIRASWYDISTGGAGNLISYDTANARLTLETSGTASTDIGWSEQQIVVGATFDTVEHVLKFQVIGAPGDKIDFQVGTTTGVSDILSPVTKEVGYHCVAFTPGDTNTPFFIQFLNRGSFRDKDVQIDNISFIDDAPVEIDSPWAEASIFNVEGPQSADVLYMFHDTTPTYKLQRFGHTTWSLVEVPWFDGPYLDENTTTTTLLPSAATGLGINLTLSSTAGVNGGLGWQSTDIGRLVRYAKVADVTWMHAVITAITSTTIAVADVRVDSAASPTAVTTWRLGAWSGTTGYPRTGAFFEERQYAASTTNQPQTFWASQTGDFENHRPDKQTDSVVEADDALAYTLSADEVNPIRWMAATQDTLSIGTEGGEWVPKADGIVITPLDITVKRQTKHGSARVQPVVVGNVVLFLQRALRRVREFTFVFEEGLNGGYLAPDVSRLARHVTKGGLTEMAFAEEPDSVIWTTRADGQIPTLTFRRDENVVGWARNILGGRFLDDNVAFSRVWQYDDSTTTFVEETTDANSTTNADWAVFPATEGADDYAAFGYTAPFAQLTFDYANGTAGIGGSVAWEYWDGTAWTSLSTTDNTTGFTVAAADGLTVTWTAPTDWAKKALSSGESLYYVRAKVSTVYSTNPILDQGFIQSSGDTVAESVVVIPGDNGAGQTHDSTSRDEIWVYVKRTINGATARTIEFFERDFETGDAQEDAYYVDSLLTYDGAAATTITGFDHLEGETVKVWADGAIVADKVVASGGFTLPTAASVVQAGLPYKHKLKTLKVLIGNPAGTPLGRTKRVNGLTFVLLNSHTFKYGPDENSLQTKDFRVVGDPMDVSAPLFTGEKFVEFEGDWDTDTRVVIESDEPAPFTLLALAPEIESSPLK